MQLSLCVSSAGVLRKNFINRAGCCFVIMTKIVSGCLEWKLLLDQKKDPMEKLIKNMITVDLLLNLGLHLIPIQEIGFTSLTKIGGMWQTLTRKDMDALSCLTYEMLKRCPGNACEDKRRQCEGEDVCFPAGDKSHLLVGLLTVWFHLLSECFDENCLVSQGIHGFTYVTKFTLTTNTTNICYIKSNQSI